MGHTASGSRLFGSVVTALDFCPGDLGSNPVRDVKSFQTMHMSTFELLVTKLGPSKDTVKYHNNAYFSNLVQN